MTAIPHPRNKNTPAATGASMHSGKAIQMLSQRSPSPGVSDALDQLRTTRHNKEMWDVDETHPYISGVSPTTYIEHLVSALEHLGGHSHVHTEGHGDDTRYFVTREVLELASNTLDAPPEVLDYFSAPDNVVSFRGRLDKVAATTNHADDLSPFDRIRQVREDGTEVWSARDLMELMGYSEWRNFERVVTEARRAADIIGAGQHQFVDSNRMIEMGKGASRAISDVETTRYGAYMVAMSCDGRKAQVAEAKTYFAVKTREAETRPVTQSEFEIPQTYPEALRFAADLADKNTELESAVEELSPKAAFYDELMEVDGSYSFAATARILGFGRNILMRELRGLGILQSNNLPYRPYDHHFTVTPGTYTNPKTGEVVSTSTTRVRPASLPFLRRKLDPGMAS